MKKLFFFLLLTPLMISSSCDNEPDVELAGDIEINFKANYDGELFQTQKVYEYVPGLDVKFTQFNFYVSNISLLEEENDTDESELVETDFIELSYDITQTAQAEAGQTIQTKKVAAGTYRALKIGFGLSPDINRTNPDDYGGDNPLNTSTHYWDPADSYIFSMIEGFSDNDGDGMFESGENESLRYHLGHDDVYVERTLFPDEAMIVREGEKLTLKINIDVKKLFEMPLNQFDLNDDNLLDIETFNESQHSDVNAEGFQLDKQLMRNFSEASSLEL